MSHLPPKPPTRVPMSEAEKMLRDRLIEKWTERHELWPEDRNWFSSELGARYVYWRHRPEQPKCVYTTTRMFDGRFWSFKYIFRKSGENAERYVLVRGSIRRHAKRKDAKARSLELCKS